MSALISMDLNRIAEAHVMGDLEVEGDLMEILPLRSTLNPSHPLAFLMRFLRPLLQGQVRADHKVVPQHYERDEEFFLSFLDVRHRCYSHGLFVSDDENLEDAMTRKFEYALEAVQAREGHHILDIGGGWGAMTEFAGMRGVRVTSITISEVSRSFIQQLIDRHKLPCEVLLEHFFEHKPNVRYDAIVNLGVTENLPDYARTLRHYDALLAPRGKVAVADEKRIASTEARFSSHGKHRCLGCPVSLSGSAPPAGGRRVPAAALFDKVMTRLLAATGCIAPCKPRPLPTFGYPSLSASMGVLRNTSRLAHMPTSADRTATETDTAANER
ncbi:hypothetical protein BH23GEM8_BH23GEM8_02920 [soil metagenome]